jgi:Cupin-like domain
MLQSSALERVYRPSMEGFAVYRKATRPVLLDGLLDESVPAQWSLRRLRERFANRIVSVIPTNGGRLCVDARTGVTFETVRFGDYVDCLERGDHPGAYVVAPGETWLPELVDELRAPEYCRDAAWRVSRFWFSAAQTSAPLHRDVAENIFFQLLGRKRFFLYPPSASPWLYSHPFRSALPNYSRFDPEVPDYRRFPLSRRLQPLEVILQPGDALYLPSRWWHQVRSLEVSASFNFWFADGALAGVVRAAEFVKRMRGLEIYGLEEWSREER